MATVNIKRCDRCGRYEDHEDAVEVTVTSQENDEADLCEPCAEGLRLYLGGHKLARNRKAKAVKP